MYHISNYGFADPNYMEHYGIVGMKWRHRHGPVHRDAARRRQLNQIREEVDKTKNYVSDPHNAGARINKEKYDEATRKLRNPQKTNRNAYGARRRAQARTSTAKSDKMLPVNEIVRRVNSQGGVKALTTREFDRIKNWMPKSRGRAEYPLTIDRWNQEHYSRPNNGRRRRR